MVQSKCATFAAQPCASHQTVTAYDCSTTASSLARKDVANHFHPYTNLRAIEQDAPLIIVEGDGIEVIDDAGKRYIEGMAGSGVHRWVSAKSGSPKQHGGRWKCCRTTTLFSGKAH